MAAAAMPFTWMGEGGGGKGGCTSSSDALSKRSLNTGIHLPGPRHNENDKALCKSAAQIDSRSVHQRLRIGRALSRAPVVSRMHR